MRKFCNDVNECLMEIGRGSRIVLIGDMNGRVGEVAGVVAKWGVDGVNENGEHPVDTCMFLANTFFRNQIIHRYT